MPYKHILYSVVFFPSCSTRAAPCPVHPESCSHEPRADEERTKLRQRARGLLPLADQGETLSKENEYASWRPCPPLIHLYTSHTPKLKDFSSTAPRSLLLKIGVYTPKKVYNVYNRIRKYNFIIINVCI